MPCVTVWAEMGSLLCSNFITLIFYTNGIIKSDYIYTLDTYISAEKSHYDNKIVIGIANVTWHDVSRESFKRSRNILLHKYGNVTL